MLRTSQQRVRALLALGFLLGYGLWSYRGINLWSDDLGISATILNETLGVS
jgi:hypothetical protein